MLKGKKILVSFASGKFYEKKRSVNTFTAKYIGKFDLIKEYTIEDVDRSFYKSNKKIFSIKKGVGLWLWKPYFIHSALMEADFGDYIFHCDTASVFIRNINQIIETLEFSGQDVLLFNLPLKEKEWTSAYVLEKLNVSSRDQNSNQISASFFVVKKSEASISFVNEWLKLCENEDILSGQQLNENNHSFPDSHRFDQSLLSILAKRRKFKTHRDPSQYGVFPEMYRTHGKIIDSGNATAKYKTSIILLRKGKLITELSKFYIKSVIRYVAPTMYEKIIKQK